jgi:hypothetical protein
LTLQSVQAQSKELNRIPNTELIVSRLESARANSRTRLKPYEVVRSYKLFAKEPSRSKSEVVAYIAFFPPAVQTYRIQKTQGLGLGETIVRKILQSEDQLLANRSASDISTENYTFRFLREDDLNGRRCYVLEIRPLRKDVNLLRGSIWVDANTYLLHRVEGEPARDPSWWVHDIHVIFDFREVEGMWLQTGLSSSANVRLLGRHTLVARDLEYKTGGLAADLITESRQHE